MIHIRYLLELQTKVREVYAIMEKAILYVVLMKLWQYWSPQIGIRKVYTFVLAVIVNTSLRALISIVGISGCYLIYLNKNLISMRFYRNYELIYFFSEALGECFIIYSMLPHNILYGIGNKTTTQNAENICRYHILDHVHCAYASYLMPKLTSPEQKSDESRKFLWNRWRGKL